MESAPLPVNAVLPDLAAALREGGWAVLIAPPGAGKTTAVAPALLHEPWCDGEILLLSPRRVAARAAAERMAETLGERAGATVGYLSRMDSRTSALTRITVMTEAIFVNRIAADPELSGVSAVLFDEAHERHLDSDLGLALALETQSVLRPDLRLLVMSATIDGARFAQTMGGAPVIESEGKIHPLTIEHIGARAELRLEDQVAGAVRRAWSETEADRDILAFLPGVREIERAMDTVTAALPGALVLPLHGQVDPAEQRRALRRDGGGRRRIVLATAIAETSLTLDGVSVVVDAGLSRRPEFDREAGLTRLVTVRASRAAIAQRAGRAARQRPGTCYRMWEAAAEGGFEPYDPPEIATADLAPLLLTLMRWGSGADELRWLDPPPAAALSAARGRLEMLGALDAEGRLTAHGADLDRMGIEPALAAMVLFGARHDAAETAARIALLLQERGLGGGGEDLAARLSRWNAARGARADASRKLAARWARRAESLVKAERAGTGDVPPPGILLAHAFPDRVARARGTNGEDWLTAGGRGLRLDPLSTLARAEWLAVGEAQGHAGGARIMAAAQIEAEDVERWLGDRIERRRDLRWNEGRAEARLQRRMGRIVLAEGPDPDPDAAAIAAMMVARVAQGGLHLLPLGRAAHGLLARARFAGIDTLSDEALRAETDTWLAPLLLGKRSFDALDPRGLHDALRARLDWQAQQTLDRVAPANFTSPAGTSHAIDYEAEGGPQVELRVQALFGLDTHPQFGSPPRPLLLQLTSPAGRPIQATRDLPAFWRGSWADVRREMKGRYPRHRWPERPWEEEASLKTRNAFEGRGRSRA
ncbi:ATP-dependent helicase HrpB [Croceicoccus hydrothermalis]|uniref:ATP-dependent helicase HrpB n=1 Tax=Croceicoccus hydrothermalis TaxID=2867964 RepID=UPI001EFAE4F1|nr:ATP-dependent helicase HrpB [Croceicoccus hydrothermalis]